jgi:hypothetical protein
MRSKDDIKPFLQRAVDRVNMGVSRTLTARLSSETPPMDYRHLTDTRTRVSTLLEYSLAYEMNILLAEEGKGFTISAVLWSVFPDLFIRDKSRVPIIGFEVKALHTAAEEKSANLSTPLHIIKKGDDFVVVVIWAWQRADVDGVSITYPHIHMVEMFDAYHLAQIRDYSWLFVQGKRIKGIDISTPLISPDDRPKGKLLKAEEGNMGKLMRIELPPELPNSVPNYDEMKAEGDRYARFKQSVLSFGLKTTFQEICDLQKASDVEINDFLAYPDAITVLGRARFQNGVPFILLAGSALTTWTKKEGQDPKYSRGSTALWLSPKLNWKLVRKGKGDWRVLAKGEKPDTAYEQMAVALS